MEEKLSNKNWYVPIIMCTLIFLMVYVISSFNYLLYHSIAETFSIVVSMAIFIVTWNTRFNVDNNCFLVIGVAYLFIGSIDLLHLLAYKGMGVFKANETNLPTQLWVSARFLQSITFLIAPFFINRKISARINFIGYTILTTMLLGTIFYWNIFPVCFIEGAGLTPFKKVSEYVISIILLISVMLYYRKRKIFDKFVFNSIIASIFLTILGEIAFTFYSNVYGISNFFGHYFKVISFYLIYKAIVETGLRRPYDVLFRNLKQNEIALGESEAKYRSMMETIQDPVYICSPDFTVAYMNAAMISRIGYNAIGRPCYETINSLDQKCKFCFFDTILKENSIVKETFRQKDGRFYHVTHSPIHHIDGSISKLTIFRDVTELKQIEMEYQNERDKALLYLDIVGSIIVVLNPDTTVALINKRGGELLENNDEDVIGMKWFDTFVPEQDREKARTAFQNIMSGEIQPFEYFENRVLTRNNKEKVISWHNAVLKDDVGKIIGMLSSGEDITEARKTEKKLWWELAVNSALSELYVPLISPDISMQGISKKILDKAKFITGSEHGYVSIIDPDTGDNFSHTLTEMMADQCKLDNDNKIVRFPKGDDGLYGGLWGYSLNTLKPFLTNSPETHLSSRALPRGHIPIKNFLSLPVLYNDILVGQIALSNKPEDYEEKDIEAISRLSQFYALAIHRWQISDSLLKAKDELEKRVAERTDALSEANIKLINEIEERNILEENLIKSEKELKYLSAKLIESYEEERRRIGEELHDGIAQTLSAIKVWSDAAISQMEKNRHSESMKSIQSILSLSKASVEEVRNIIKNLRPTILDDLGLKAAISWLCQEFEKTHQNIVLEREMNMNDGQMPENLNIVIFRILQEALNNISKHSMASHVSVLLNRSLKKIELKIYDNGVGFKVNEEAEDREHMEKGIGLTTMEERARFSGGIFNIISSPARGTLIRATWEM
jgi:PAS domain S-box-containing protein